VAGTGGLSLVFVYGSLRRGGAAHGRLRGAELIAPARYQGRLYDLGEYPGAVPSADAGDAVHGELYRLPAVGAEALLARLDRYEGPEYRRERARVGLEARGEARECWIYLYRGDLDGRRRVASGDWGRSLPPRGAPAGGQQG